MYLEQTNFSIAQKLNSRLPTSRKLEILTEQAIAEKLGLAIDNPVGAHFFEVTELRKSKFCRTKTPFYFQYI
jgi:hypothetical protein